MKVMKYWKYKWQKHYCTKGSISKFLLARTRRARRCPFGTEMDRKTNYHRNVKKGTWEDVSNHWESWLKISWSTKLHLFFTEILPPLLIGVHHKAQSSHTSPSFELAAFLETKGLRLKAPKAGFAFHLDQQKDKRVERQNVLESWRRWMCFPPRVCCGDAGQTHYSHSSLLFCALYSGLFKRGDHYLCPFWNNTEACAQNCVER